MNQCEAILNYIQEHGSITQRQASRYCGSIRLAARIYDLRAMGHDIVKETITVRCKDGRKAKVARYTLNEGS